MTAMRVFFDVTDDGASVGRNIMELRPDANRNISKNFVYWRSAKDPPFIMSFITSCVSRKDFFPALSWNHMKNVRFSSLF